MTVNSARRSFGELVGWLGFSADPPSGVHFSSSKESDVAASASALAGALTFCSISSSAAAPFGVNRQPNEYLCTKPKEKTSNGGERSTQPLAVTCPISAARCQKCEVALNIRKRRQPIGVASKYLQNGYLEIHCHPPGHADHFVSGAWHNAMNLNAHVLQDGSLSSVSARRKRCVPFGSPGAFSATKETTFCCGSTSVRRWSIFRAPGPGVSGVGGHPGFERPFPGPHGAVWAFFSSATPRDFLRPLSAPCANGPEAPLASRLRRKSQSG